MSFKVTGIVKVILPEVVGTSAKGEWKKRDFVIEEYDPQYPKQICFTLFNDKNDTFSKISVGKEVEVSFSVESREYNGKYFSNVNAFRVDVVSAGNSATPPQTPPSEPEDNDSLPF